MLPLMDVWESPLLIHSQIWHQKKNHLIISPGSYHSTMKSKGFKILLLCFITVNAFSQYRLSGIIISGEDTTAVKECVIYLNDDKRSAIPDPRGQFVFEDVSNG